MSLRLLTIAAAVLTLLAADAPDKASKKDLEKMQGAWKVQTIQKAGKDVKPDDIGGASLRIAGNKYTLSKDGKILDEGTITLDAGKKQPAIDIQPTRDGAKKVVGIYKIDGDTFTEALVPEGMDRPTELVSKEGSDILVIVFQREKK